MNDVSFIEPVCSAQVARTLFPSLEGKHMIELIICWPPKGSPKGEAKFFPPALPVVVDLSCEFLEIRQTGELFIVALYKSYHPTLAARQYAVSSRTPLKLHYHLLQELFPYYLFGPCKTLTQARKEQPIYF